MLINKQNVIDAYGHFFVVVERHPATEKGEGFLGRAHEDTTYYRHIGNLNLGWEPHQLQALEIHEFFGKPSLTNLGDYGLLHAINYDSERNQSYFLTLEEAEKKANDIRAEIAALYETLREEAKTRTLDFDLTTPDLPTVYRLQPEEVVFPTVYKKGTAIYGFNHNVFAAPLEIFESEILSASLSARQISGHDAPFAYTYDLDISLAVPIPGEKGRLSLEDRTLYRKEPSGDTWQFKMRPPANSQTGQLSFARTREDAERLMREFAERVRANIAHVPAPEKALAPAAPTPGGPQ